MVWDVAMFVGSVHAFVEIHRPPPLERTTDRPRIHECMLVVSRNYLGSMFCSDSTLRASGKG